MSLAPEKRSNSERLLPYERDSTIPRVFRGVVAEHPDAIALQAAGRAISYCELADRSRRLAAVLRARGVGPEVPVALALPRSIELVVAVLGVLEAGGWYAPLDPTLPPERQAYLLEDCKAHLVLTSSDGALALSAAGVGADRRLDLNDLEAAMASVAPITEPGTIDARQLAYVMYTSGSTGKPKGVAASHRAVLRLVRNSDFMRFGPDETFLLLAPPAFDASTLELWGPLLNGGKLVIHPEARPSLDGLAEVIESTGVTALWLTAGLFHQVVESSLDRLRAVRQLLAGGDVLSAEHVRKVLDTLPGITMINGYGPTENTTFTCCHAMTIGPTYDADTDLAHGVPIGRTIANTTIRILDDDLRQVPVGQPGELFAGGDGLARAYLGQPALTADRFVPDPLAEEPGGRLYRTGDRVAWREDGVLRFFGRLDDQVKVRGYRIEPGEITHVLLDHTAVRNAVTVTCTVTAGGAEDKRLATYLVAESSATAADISPGALAEWLGQRLPAYMVPSAFVVLDALPLNVNGKVDRKSLPSPVWGHGPRTGSAATATEARLIELWAEALGVETVGTGDNFFAFGGHSLLATRLVARVSEAFGVDLALGDIYAHPAVASVARLLDQRRARVDADADAFDTFCPSEREGRCELSFEQRRLWFHHQLHPRSGLYNIPVALDLSGPLDTARLARAVGALVDRHEPLRTCFPEIGDVPRQSIEPPSTTPLPLTIVDLTNLEPDVQAQECDRLSRAEAAAPFDLASGPVLRASLLRLAEDRHRFLLTVHHIAFDGWSIDIVLHELEALYDGRPLDPLALQYADFAAWRGQRFGDDSPNSPMSRGLDFWRRHLDGVPSVFDLAADHKRPTTPLLVGETHAFRIDPAALAPLRRLVRDEGATLFLGLLAVYQAVLYRRTGVDRFVVGTPSSGRDHPATQAMVGFFVNLTPMVADMSDGPSLRLLLRRARDQARTVFKHQDLPFDRLVEALSPPREASRHPLVQVVLSLETALFRHPRLTGLEVERVRVTTGTAKFDLLLYAEETADGGLDAWFEFPVELFEPATVAALADDFRRAVDELVAGPDWPISSEASEDHVEPTIAADDAAGLGRAPANRRGPVTEPLVAESLVAGVFADVLGLDRPADRDASFFELGGHSLLATQMAARLRRAFEVELAIGDIFEHATVASLAAHLEATRRADASLDIPDVVVAADRDPANTPLSFAQERLWFLEHLNPGSPVYNIPEVLDLEGPVEIDALTSAAADMMARHRVLRGHFRMVDGQTIHDTSGEAGDLADRFIRQLDLRAEEDPLACADRLTAEASTTPFDLARGPLVRVLVMRVAATHHRLVWVVHHAVFDGWSVGLLHRDLSIAYRFRRAGLQPELPELAVDYGDYAVWQRRWLSEEVLEPQIAFWRAHLAGAPTALDLPADRPRPARQSTAGGNVRFRLNAATTAAIEKVARQANATPFMVLCATFAVFLSRHTGQTDLVVGTPVAGRGQEATEDLVGLFVNTLPLRIELGGRPRFAELVARVRSAALGAFDHQDVPFNRLVEALETPRDLSRTPLFQVFFAFANTPPPRAEIDGVRIDRLPPETASARCDLGLMLEPDDDGIAGTFEYATALFDRLTVERFVDRFEHLLRAAVATPDTLIADLPMLVAGDRTRLDAWNATGSTGDLGPRAETLHGLFAARATRTPDAIALIGEDGVTSTYAELLQRAARLAHHLRDLGIEPEERIGVCLERNGDLVASILAVLFAGGAYVPLDPAYPERRLAFMVRDSGLRWVLTDTAFADRVPAASNVTPLTIDDPAAWWGGADPARDRPPLVSVDPSQLAYLIYTSGSTGRSKGVAIEHRQAVAMVRWAKAAFEPGDLAGVVAATSVCFDLSVFELFVPLATGGTVLLVRNALVLLDPPLAIAERATLVNSVPSVIAEVLRAGDLPAGIRVVNLAGEPLPGALADELYARGVGAVWNLYGPSEDTTYSTAAPIPRGSAIPSIGAPITGSRVLLLDAEAQPVPPGAEGEIYLVGEGVSRGYLGQPSLTAARFLPAPLADRPGARVYRTGDRARWQEDGELRFLGRLDHQVKIRGFRIELGEIEATLRRHQEVAEAAALAPIDEATEGGVAERQLLAWVVPAGSRQTGSEPAASDHPNQPLAARLRTYLAEHLPAYFVPSKVIELDALPRLPNGKLDRKALRDHAAASAPARGAGNVSTPPSTLLEELLCSIWADVLKLELPTVGLETHFFDAGGHSLAAVRLSGRIRESLGVELPLREVFAHPTLAAQARWLESAGGLDAAAGPPPIVVRRRPLDDAPLSFAQQRLWLLERLQPGTAAYHVPLALELEGPIDRTALAHVLTDLVARHEVLRTVWVEPTFTESEQEFIAEARQRSQPPTPVVMPIVDLSGLPSGCRTDVLRRLSWKQARRLFDFARGPLVRMTLLRLLPERHRLLVVFHHGVVDVLSTAIFADELATLYCDRTAGRASSLAPLPVQYSDYALWERQWLQGDVTLRQLTYWRKRLAGVPPLELPTDRPRPRMARFDGDEVAGQLSADVVKTLHQLCSDRHMTPFMVLLTAFQVLLARWSGHRDIAVGTAVAGRPLAELQGLVGLFVNTLVLRQEILPHQSFDELLRAVRATTLDAFTHQDLPFERLVEDLQPERDLSRSPLFQVQLLFQPRQPEKRRVAGLDFEMASVSSGTVKFDLTLALWPDGDGFAFAFAYATHLFDRSTIERLAASFTALVEALVREPSAPISAPSLVSASDHRMLLRWGTGMPLPPAEPQIPHGLTLHGLFLARAESSPEAIALIDGERCVRYDELAEGSAAVAAELRRRGLQPEEPVGVLLPRTPALVTALLGVMRAGGAYLPLDPSYPITRTTFILNDAGARWVLTTPEGADQLAAGGGKGTAIDVDSLEEARFDEDRSAIDTERLAYLMYTSGSTGRPKGIAVAHQQAVALIRWGSMEFSDAQLDHTLASTSVCFDLSVFELFLPLARGCTVVLAENLLALPTLPAAERVTLVNTVASSLAALLRMAVLPRSAMTVIQCGEPLKRVLVDAIRDQDRSQGLSAPRQVYNIYGPTEDTVYSTFAQIGAGAGEPSIGVPIAGGLALVVDGAGSLAPVGATGELLLGGVGVTRGYLGRPRLTAERFVPDPFSGAKGERLYRTGDRIRWRNDGHLMFLGRLDHQVKVRGFRIEPGEIEAQLVSHPEVDDAVVMTRGDEAGDRRLVAWVASGVPRDGRATLGAALRVRLAEQLPAYMVPAAIAVLAALPQTPNGKIDRKALREPALSKAAEATFIKPEVGLQRPIAEVWQKVLKVDRVGARDNFFDLGGTSLTLAELEARLRKEVGRKISMVDLLRHPTVESQAELLMSEHVDVPLHAAHARIEKQRAMRSRRLVKRGLR